MILISLVFIRLMNKVDIFHYILIYPNPCLRSSYNTNLVGKPCKLIL